jgi:phosphatidate cytidylyltransferase
MPDSALAKRIGTALVLAAICLPAIVWLPESISVLMLAAIILMGAWEWSAFLAIPGSVARATYLCVVGAVLFAVRWLIPAASGTLVVIYLGLLWWGIALLLILRYPWRISRGTTFVCGFLVLVPAWVALYSLLGSAGNRRYLLLLVLAIVWSADVGAYFAGRFWGKVKLAPQVSPGKTWEGVIGGVLSAACTAILGAALLGLPIAMGAPLGISVAAISIVGDLTVSMFKRNAGLKDSGRLFPGHGGVLDRVDSVTAAAPLFLLEASWVGWVTL